jgi:hypothetical protein
MSKTNSRSISELNSYHIIALVTALILSIPLIAMQFTEEVQWTLSDFIIMGTLIFGTGMIFDYAMRKARNNTNKVAFGFVILFLFLYIWTELAVGVFTNLGS